MVKENMKEIQNYLEKCNYVRQKIENQIEKRIIDFSNNNGYNPVEHTKGRTKSLDSIEEKLKRYQKDISIQNIKHYVKDVIGIRIVCSFLTDVYDIVHLISHTKNIFIKEREDYINKPKDTGYMSYHLQALVPIYFQEQIEYFECEIQIRTVAMDFWATLDHKIAYKFQKVIPDEIKSQMYAYAQIVQELDKQMLELNKIVQKYKKTI